jgi:hypothetical protein
MQTSLINPHSISVQTVKDWMNENVNPQVIGTLQSRTCAVMEGLKESSRALKLFLDVVFFCASKRTAAGQTLRSTIIENPPNAWEWYVADPSQKWIGEVYHQQVLLNLDQLRHGKQWTLRELLQSLRTDIQTKCMESQFYASSQIQLPSDLTFNENGEVLFQESEKIFQTLLSKECQKLSKDVILNKVAALHWNLARALNIKNRLLIESVIVILLLNYQFLVTPYDGMDGYTKAMLYDQAEFIREYGSSRELNLLAMASPFQLKMLKRMGGMNVFKQLPEFQQLFPLPYIQQHPLPQFKDIDSSRLTSRVMRCKYRAMELVLAKDTGNCIHLFCQTEVGKSTWQYSASHQAVQTDSSQMPIKILFNNLYQEPWLREFDRSWFRNSDALEKSHQTLAKMSQEIKQKMYSDTIWDDPIFIQEISLFMELAYAEVELFYRELINAANGDTKKMVELMGHQQRKKGEPNYCYYYFRNSLTEMYHLARCRVSFNQEGIPQISWLSLNDVVPYFQPGTPQFHWRELYNQFCQKLNDHQLRFALTDERFSQWAQPDLNQLDDFNFPKVQPT